MKKLFFVLVIASLAACGGKKKTDNTMKPGSGSDMGSAMGSDMGSGSGDAGGGSAAPEGGGGGG
jgi:hypothetical protein